jgi:hypothetical protein
MKNSMRLIQSPIHDNFSYASFSEGEKMRIDLALLFTWREVAAFKNSVIHDNFSYASFSEGEKMRIDLALQRMP